MLIFYLSTSSAYRVTSSFILNLCVFFYLTDKMVVILKLFGRFASSIHLPTLFRIPNCICNIADVVMLFIHTITTTTHYKCILRKNSQLFICCVIIKNYMKALGSIQCKTCASFPIPFAKFIFGEFHHRRIE